MNQNVDEAPVVTTKYYTLNEALETAGMGRFQWMLILLIGAVFAIDSCQVFMMTFMIPCVRDVWALDSIWEALIPATFFVGVLFASIIWSKFADMYGRRRALILGMFVMSISTSATIFVTNIYQLLIFRFLSGLGYIQPIIITLVMEFSPIKARAKSMVFTYYCWTAGGIFSILLAWLIIPNMDAEIGWRIYIFGTIIPALIVTITTFWVPESPRWYSTMGEIEKAEKLIRQVLEINGKEPLQGRMVQESKSIQERGKIKDMLLPKYRIASFILLFSYTACGFCYFGVAFISKRLFKDYSLYISEFVTNLAELPGAAVGLLMNTVGWKWMMIYTRSIPAICFAIVAILWYNVTSVSYIWFINVLLIFLARGLCWASDMVLLTYISAYYPTAIRATAVGLSLGFLRLGAIASMFITLELRIVTGLTILSIVSMVACIVSLLLTDITIKDELIDTVDRSECRTSAGDNDTTKSSKYNVLMVDRSECRTSDGDNDTTRSSKYNVLM